MEADTLYLPLKAKWYDMIESGVKTKEYREITPYWIRRLTTLPFPLNVLYSLSLNELIGEISGHDFLKKFKKVRFSYGYTRRTMTFECNGIEMNTGIPEWGAKPGVIYFVIKLGKRLK